jgi:tripartite-type tricarboxylate transporter receptor subunit TctC
VVTCRRRVFIASALLAAIWGSGGMAHAEPYPSRPIKIIVAGSAGTALDVTARYFAEPLSKRLNTAVVLENRAGAGGATGVEAVAKAAPDGYTLLFGGMPIFSTRWTSETPVAFDPIKDLTPIAKVNGAALAVVVPPASSFKTLADLVSAMRAKPGELTYSSGGNGSTSHLCTLLLNDMTRTSARHVAYKGNGAAITDTAGGQVDFTCNSSVVVPLVMSGKLRALAVSSRNRWDALPEVPTVAEAGIPGFDVSSWMGVMAPTGTPAAVVQRLSDEFVRLAQMPEFKEFCAKQTMYLEIADHKQFLADIPKENIRWKRIGLLSRGT